MLREIVLMKDYICRVYVCCSRLASSKSPTIHQTLNSYISEALDHAPSLVVLDDLDSIIASPNNSEDYHSSPSSTLLMGFLIDILDECEVLPSAFYCYSHLIDRYFCSCFHLDESVMYCLYESCIPMIVGLITYLWSIFLS